MGSQLPSNEAAPAFNNSLNTRSRGKYERYLLEADVEIFFGYYYYYYLNAICRRHIEHIKNNTPTLYYIMGSASLNIINSIIKVS